MTENAPALKLSAVQIQCIQYDIVGLSSLVFRLDRLNNAGQIFHKRKGDIWSSSHDPLPKMVRGLHLEHKSDVDIYFQVKLGQKDSVEATGPYQKS